MSGGGLFVNNPVAPTEECIDLMRDLESKYGPVKFIVLSSLALEHKGTAGAFATQFPASSIFVQPGQFSFPINLPTNFFFPFGKTIKEIPSNSSQAPWYSDLDHAVLSVQPSPVGGFGETAFFHRASKTLLVTDTIVKVIAPLQSCAIGDGGGGGAYVWVHFFDILIGLCRSKTSLQP